MVGLTVHPDAPGWANATYIPTFPPALGAGIWPPTQAFTGLGSTWLDGPVPEKDPMACHTVTVGLNSDINSLA